MDTFSSSSIWGPVLHPIADCEHPFLDIVLPEDPAIPLLRIYPEDVPTGKKDTCSTMFIVALFVIVRCWNQPKCPTTEEWIQKIWFIYIME